MDKLTKTALTLILSIFTPLIATSQFYEDQEAAISDYYEYWAEEVQHIDICWSSDQAECDGEQPANEFCKSKGHSSAHAYQFSEPQQDGTNYMKDSSACSSECRGFLYIACK